MSIKQKKRICPICNVGELTSHSEDVIISDINVPSRYSVCDFCGCEQADCFEVNYNAKKMKEARAKNNNQ